MFDTDWRELVVSVHSKLCSAASRARTASANEAMVAVWLFFSILLRYLHIRMPPFVLRSTLSVRPSVSAVPVTQERDVLLFNVKQRFITTTCYVIHGS